MLEQELAEFPSRTTSAVQGFSGVMTSSPLIDIFTMSFASRSMVVRSTIRIALFSSGGETQSVNPGERIRGDAGVPPQKILKAPLSRRPELTERQRLNKHGPRVEFRIIGRKTVGTGGGDSGRRCGCDAGASPAAPAPDEGQAKAVIAPLVAPSVEADKNASAAMTGKDDQAGGSQAGGSSVAIASFEGAAVDLLGEALAALEDRDYATAQRLFTAIGRKDAADAIRDALAALDRKDYATAQGLFEALGQKSAAVTQLKRSAPASAAPPQPAAWAGRPMSSDSRNKAQQEPIISPPEVIPIADAAYRRPLPQAKKIKSRRLKPLLLLTGLALIAVFGASAIYGSPLNWTFPTTKSQAIAGLESAHDVLKADLEAITGQSAREKEQSAMRDMSAALTEVTVRLDRIEHESGARLDKLSERVDQDSSSRLAEIAARLDRLEKKPASPATPASEIRRCRGEAGQIGEESRCRGCARLRIRRHYDKAQQAGEESRRPGPRFGQAPRVRLAETIVAHGGGGAFRLERNSQT